MKKSRLNLYTIDTEYGRLLSEADSKVFSVSPKEHKENRPFVGIVVVCSGQKYCVPLTSPKEKHKSMKNDVDFSKIINKKGRLIGALNFNNMIPVNSDVVFPIDITPTSKDSYKIKAYKSLLNDQLDWCNDNYDMIIKKTNKLYNFVTKTPEKSRNLTRRCCDFKKLEKVLDSYTQKRTPHEEQTVDSDDDILDLTGGFSNLRR